MTPWCVVLVCSWRRLNPIATHCPSLGPFPRGRFWHDAMVCSKRGGGWGRTPPLYSSLGGGFQPSLQPHPLPTSPLPVRPRRFVGWFCGRQVLAYAGQAQAHRTMNTASLSCFSTLRALCHGAMRRAAGTLAHPSNQVLSGAVKESFLTPTWFSPAGCRAQFGHSVSVQDLLEVTT